jgi:hypothetical protein
LRKDELVQHAQATEKELSELKRKVLWAALFGGTLGFLTALGF